MTQKMTQIFADAQERTQAATQYVQNATRQIIEQTATQTQNATQATKEIFMNAHQKIAETATGAQEKTMILVNQTSEKVNKGIDEAKAFTQNATEIMQMNLEDARYHAKQALVRARSAFIGTHDEAPDYL